MIKGALDDMFAYQEFEKLINKFNIKKIVETGTYFGWSAKKLNSFNIPIHTIEIVEDNYNKSKEFLKDYNNINCYLGSSPVVLNEILEENEENVLFFLDAHWDSYWPLLDELNVIFEKKIKKPVISIHDFYVPDENGNAKFSYDTYHNTILNFNYIEDSINKIYNKNFDYHYTTEIDCVNSGLIYIYPN